MTPEESVEALRGSALILCFFLNVKNFLLPHPNAVFSNLSIAVFLGRTAFFLFFWDLPCVLSSSLPSSHWKAVCFRALPNVPQGMKSPPVGNQCTEVYAKVLWNSTVQCRCVELAPVLLPKGSVLWTWQNRVSYLMAESDHSADPS